jgi:hypothetical protein
LAETQALFWRAVRGQRPPRGVSEVFANRGALSVVERMQIYRAAYWARHEKSLQETYPRLFAVLGEQPFRALVASFIEAHPSQVPAIEWAGRAFPEHVATHLPATHDDPALGDLARLEWARVHAVLAPDAPRDFDAQCVAAPDAPERRVRTIPSLSLVRVQARALSLLREDATPLEGDEGDQPRCVAVWRGRGGTREAELDHEQAAALQRALAGETLAAACACFAEPNAAERAAIALGEWIRRGWIAALEESHA